MGHDTAMAGEAVTPSSPDPPSDEAVRMLLIALRIEPYQDKAIESVRQFADAVRAEERDRCLAILRAEMTPSWVNTLARIERALGKATVRESRTEWIACAERKPEGKARTILVVYTDGSHGCWKLSQSYPLASGVVHWREYPALPAATRPEPEGANG